MPGRLSDLAAVTATEASSLSTAATAGASSPATSSSYGDFVGKRRASGCGERDGCGATCKSNGRNNRVGAPSRAPRKEGQRGDLRGPSNLRDGVGAVLE